MAETEPGREGASSGKEARRQALHNKECKLLEAIHNHFKFAVDGKTVVWSLATVETKDKDQSQYEEELALAAKLTDGASLKIMPVAPVELHLNGTLIQGTQKSGGTEQPLFNAKEKLIKALQRIFGSSSQQKQWTWTVSEKTELEKLVKEKPPIIYKDWDEMAESLKTGRKGEAVKDKAETWGFVDKNLTQKRKREAKDPGSADLIDLTPEDLEALELEFATKEKDDGGDEDAGVGDGALPLDGAQMLASVNKSKRMKRVMRMAVAHQLTKRYRISSVESFCDHERLELQPTMIGGLFRYKFDGVPFCSEVSGEEVRLATFKAGLSTGYNHVVRTFYPLRNDSRLGKDGDASIVLRHASAGFDGLLRLVHAIRGEPITDDIPFEQPDCEATKSDGETLASFTYDPAADCDLLYFERGRSCSLRLSNTAAAGVVLGTTRAREQPSWGPHARDERDHESGPLCFLVMEAAPIE